jgi:hypothetical protein
MANHLQAGSALFLVQDQEDPELALSLAWDKEDSRFKFALAAKQDQEDTFISEAFDVSDTNLIIRSSDLVNFRVHKLVLAMASPFFKDLLSLPQPSDSESVDGLPVVQLSENSELLRSLISMLYPVPAVMPNSYEKVLYFPATCQR